MSEIGFGRGIRLTLDGEAGSASGEDFQRTLAQLLDDLTGSVTLEPVAELGGRGKYETDQSYLRETARQLASFLDDR